MTIQFYNPSSRMEYKFHTSTLQCNDRFCEIFVRSLFGTNENPVEFHRNI